MQIKVNGTPHTLSGSQTVAALVEALKLDATQVAVERNRVIVPRSRWQEEPLQADDEVEIVRFIGGG